MIDLKKLAELGANVTELRLCEATRVHLKSDQLYYFTVDPTCEACLEALVAAQMPRIRAI